MSLEQMKVFNEYYMPATIETLSQKVEVFNERSNGAILLTTEGFTGDFLQRSFWKALGSGRRVDRYKTNSEVTPTALAQDQENKVKIAGGIGPLLYEPSQLTWLQKPTAEAIEVISSNLSSILLEDQLNTGIMAAIAAMKGNAAESVLDVSATSSANYEVFNDTHALFGDHSGNLVATVINGATYHRLIGNNLNQYKELFQANNVRVIDVLGKAYIVTDSPYLRAGANVNALHLSDGGIIISDGGDVISNIDTKNGKERIETTLQIDYTFGAGIKGYSWEGGKSPLDEEIAKSENWKKVVDVKKTAGVLTICSATPKASTDSGSGLGD